MLAKEYIKRSLVKDPNNIWMLKHYVKIYQKDRNYNGAIKIQKKIVNLNLKENSIQKLLNHHYDENLQLFFENVAPDGSHPDTVDGRLIIPGHTVEAMWIVMDLAAQTNDIKTIEKASNITLKMLEYGWDKKYGGLFYFMDAQNKPMQWKLDWDQKLWWVHNEALIAVVKAYQHTKRQDVWAWFEKVHQYTWKQFPDPEFGEWFGYLRRDGAISNQTKGTSWKGPFHIPRMMLTCSIVISSDSSEQVTMRTTNRSWFS